MLYEKHRPSKITDMVGNFDSIITEACKSTGPRVFLFDGPTGTGKSTLSFILANAVGADGFDLRYINGSDATGVESMRDLLDYVEYLPSGNAKVVIIDECAKLSPAAWASLRIPLENTPSWLYWIFCTSSANKIPKDSIGRMYRVLFPKIREDDLFKIVKDVCVQYELNVGTSVLASIVDAADGSARKALTDLEAITSLPVDKQAEAVIHLGGDDDPQVIDLARCLYGASHWADVIKILKGLKDSGVEAEAVRRTLLSYGSSMLLNGNPKGSLCKHFTGSTYDDGFPGVVVMCYKAKHG